MYHPNVAEMADPQLPDPTAAISARGLTKQFDAAPVVNELDLDVHPGTILGLIGPSGCGKTTTVRLLAGLLVPTAGRAWVRGRPATELRSSDRQRLGYLPQAPALFPDLSLAENLSFHASMYGLPFRRGRRLDTMLDWVELGEHRHKRVSDASGGMQRRLALAAALVHGPDVVFLDEPTAGIDPILRDRFWAHFRELADSGVALVVTTQYVGEAGRCDQVGLLELGELLLLDTPDQLRRQAFGGEVVELTLAQPNAAEVADQLSARNVVDGVIEHPTPTTVRVVVDDARTAIGSLTRACGELGVEVAAAGEHVVDYDEAFVRVVERHRDRQPEVTDAPA
jgi:ABC-2 type transport system ATP-binding protein